MRRIVRLVLVALAVAATVAVVLVAPTAAEPGPSCSDIDHGSSPSYSWDANTGTGSLDFEVYLRGAAPCKNLNYTLYVVTDPGTEPQATVTTFAPQSDGGLGFTATVQDDDNTIYLFMTTSGKSHVFDTAPDAATPTCTSGCLEVVADTTGGASGFN